MPAPCGADGEAAAIAAGFAKAGVAKARWHLFLCLGPECAPMEEGTAVWEFLKREIAVRKLDAMRTKAQCLRVCAGGPWLLVYPGGVWYGAVTTEKCGRILDEHIAGGKPVEEWVAMRNPLGNPA